MGLPPLQESGPNVRFCCPCRQWGRVACKDGQEKSQSSLTTDAMLPSRLLLERFIVRAERWRHHPRVGRGRPVSARPTPAPRQPISVVAAAHQPPHTVSSESSLLSTASVWILPPHLSPWRDRGCRYGISNENLIQVCLTLGWSSVVFALCLLKESKVMTYSDPLVTHSHPKMTFTILKMT